MKTIIVTLLCLFFTITSFGQLTKGNLLLGGNAKLYLFQENNSTSTYDYNYTQIDVSANVGYFLADKIAFGLRPTFSTFKGGYYSTGGSITTNSQRYLIGPYGRYYFLPIDKDFNILTDIGYQYGLLGGGLKGNASTFSAAAGPVIFFNNSVGIEFLLGYSSSKENADYGYSFKRKGFQFLIGFQIHLEK